ncbi:hypothetical protein EPN52_14835 [bacterium]|nr:MAG: hypothetical protein EPN52_14835 [bacterium]
MNRRSLLTALGVGALCTLPQLPAWASEAKEIAVDGFTFVVPDGWRHVKAGAGENSVTHLGLWVQGNYADQAFIALDEDQDPGSTLAAFAQVTENDMRSRLSKVFVDTRDKLQMPNGMPALRMKVEYLAGDSDTLYQQYVWLIYDGQIGISLAVGGRVGRIDLDQATKIASTLTVVWRGDGPPPPP